MTSLFRRSCVNQLVGALRRHRGAAAFKPAVASFVRPLHTPAAIPRVHHPSPDEDEMEPVYKAIQGRLGAAPTSAAAEQQNAFYVVNKDKIRAQFAQWEKLLPRVDPHYAVKCNPDPVILQTLAELGCGFDCASAAEIDAVLALGVSPDRIIYANPCKMPAQIAHARDVDVKLMTFDNEDELHKIKAISPNARVVLRILVDDSSAVCRLGVKFGAGRDAVPKLFETAKSLGLDVAGVSFHVGSGCMDPTAFASAVYEAKRAFDLGRAAGFSMDVLDIGGGFPGNSRPLPTETGDYAPTFIEIACHLAPALDKAFPADFCKEHGVRIISEPGRYFAAASHTLLVNVFARRETATAEGPSFMYYVNDGLYGSFNCMLYDHQTVMPELIMSESDGLTSVSPDQLQPVEPRASSSPLLQHQAPTVGAASGGALMRAFSSAAPAPVELYPASVWGPTCDGLDCIVKNTKLPKLETGQWLLFRDMGAYTAAAGSRFNGFELPEPVYIG